MRHSKAGLFRFQVELEPATMDVDAFDWHLAIFLNDFPRQHRNKAKQISLQWLPSAKAWSSQPVYYYLRLQPGLARRF